MLNNTPVISKTLPILTVSEANKKDHWAIASRRHKMQQKAIRLLMPKGGYPCPCLVIFSRLGGRTLDTDNLAMAFKWIRDTLSDRIVDSWDGPWKAPSLTAKRPKGLNDSDTRIEWRYAQEGHEEKGIRIDIFPNEIVSK